MKGVLLYDSGLEGEHLSVAAKDVKRRATASFGDDKASRELLWHKDSTFIGEVTQVFIEVGGDGSRWLVFTPEVVTGLPSKKNNAWGVKRVDGIEGDRPLYLFAHEEKITWVEEE